MIPSRPPPPGNIGGPARRARLAAWAASPRARRTVLGTVLVLALVGGLQARSGAWRATQSIRYDGDLISAFHRGTLANEVGYLRFHEHEITGPGSADYGPLRLLVVATWVRWLRTTYPGAPNDGWQRRYVKPLLRLNVVAELATAAGIFLLVRRWTRRTRAAGAQPGVGAGSSAGGSGPHGGRLSALAAALLFWFNPAVIWNAHVYPQWDTWLMPFFVFALLAASADRWFWAGALVAVGAMLKGQILLVAPLFVVWPLLSRRWEGALRWVAGLACVGMLHVSPWLVPSWTAALWVASVPAAFVVLSGTRSGRERWWVAAAAVGWGTLWPWILAPGQGWVWGLAMAVAVLGAARVAPRTQRAAVAALLLAAALLVSGVVFDGSFAWYESGYARRVASAHNLRAPSVSNLGVILSRRGWTAEDPVWGGKDEPESLLAAAVPTLRSVLVLAYAAALLLCALGASRHAGRQDPRFLVAVTAPWVLLFALLPGMHQRYLVWGSGLTAAVVSVGVLPAAAHLVVTAVGWGMMAHTQLALQPGAAPGLLRLVRRLYPETGAWAVLACGAMLLTLALWPPRQPEDRHDGHPPPA